MAQLFGIARLGRNAEVRRTTQGEAVANLSLAFTYGRKDQDGKKPTQWVDASLWGQRAELLAAYLIKGTTLCVTLDDVHIEEYQKREGGQGNKLVGRVSNIEFAAKPPEHQQTSQPAQQNRHGQTAPNAYAQTRDGYVAPASTASIADMDDDIPF